MYLKNLLFVFVAVLAASGVAVPAFADKFTDEMAAVDEYKRKVDKYFKSTEIYEAAVDNKKYQVQQMDAEVNAKLQRFQQEQQYAAPPAGEFSPAPQSEVRLVPRTFYYRDAYYGGCVVVDGLFPPYWTYPGWYAGLPPYGWPIIGRVGAGWNRGIVIVNNVTVSNSRIDRGAFDQHVRGNFHNLRANSNPMHPRQQFRTLRGNANALQPQRQFHPQRNMSVVRSPHQFHRQQFQPQLQPRPQYRSITPAPRGEQTQRDGRQQHHR